MKDNQSILHIFTIYLLLLFITACDLEVYTGPGEISELLNRTVKITSEPSGFFITLNGVEQGLMTPDSLTWLTDDDNVITLTSKYYNDTSFTVVFDSAHMKIARHIDFTIDPAMRGSISCISQPEGAEIFLNDSPTGEITPTILQNLLPGQYQVEFKLPVHESTIFDVEVYSGLEFLVDTAMVDTSVWVLFNEARYNLPIDDATSVAKDINGITWVGLNNKGLAKYENNVWSLINEANSFLPDNYITDIMTTGSGIVVATNGGLFIRDGENETVLNSANSGLSQEMVTSIQLDADGGLLIGANAAFFTFMNNVWTSWHALNSNIPRAVITTIEVDCQNKLWIGSGLGLAKLENNVWVPLEGQVFASYRITASGHNRAGDIFFANSHGGTASLVKYSGDTWTSLESINLTGIISDIAFDQENSIWLATNSGLFKYNGALTHYTVDNSKLVSNNLTGIDIDTEGNIWISTGDKGVMKYKPYNE